jgi:hypothetical protein
MAVILRFLHTFESWRLTKKSETNSEVRKLTHVYDFEPDGLWRIQPSSRSRRTNAAIHWFCVEGVLAPKYPMVGTLPACCARAASGHAEPRDELSPSHR